MKKLVNTLFLLCAVISLSSCLKSGLEDLPEYEDAEILSVHRVEYRFISQDVSNASGQPIVKFATLTHRGTVNKEEGTVAYRFDNQLDDETKNQRVEEVMLLQQQIIFEKNEEFIGKTMRVMIEGEIPL